MEGIISEIETLKKYMGCFLEEETSEYINNLLESYHNHRDVEDEILETLYFKEFNETLETAKEQLKHQRINYDALIANQIIDEITM